MVDQSDVYTHVLSPCVENKVCYGSWPPEWADSSHGTHAAIQLVVWCWERAEAVRLALTDRLKTCSPVCTVHKDYLPPAKSGLPAAPATEKTSSSLGDGAQVRDSCADGIHPFSEPVSDPSAGTTHGVFARACQARRRRLFPRQTQCRILGDLNMAVVCSGNGN